MEWVPNIVKPPTTLLESPKVLNHIQMPCEDLMLKAILVNEVSSLDTMEKMAPPLDAFGPEGLFSRGRTEVDSKDITRPHASQVEEIKEKSTCT